MRKLIFEIIEVAEDNDKCSKIYDTFMMITICVSIFPLAFKNQTGVFNVIDFGIYICCGLYFETGDCRL